MIDLQTDWRFRESRVCRQRIERLSEAVGRSELLRDIQDNIDGIKFGWRGGNREARGHHRAEFRVGCSPKVVDVFFNGISGIRAHFYRSAELGDEFNRFMLEGLADRLMSAASLENVLGRADRVKLSLMGASSKIWIDEEGSTLDRTTTDAEKLIALEVPHWCAAAKRTTASFAENRNPKPKVKEKALLGVQTPEADRIGVFGAWLCDKDLCTEFVVPSKRDRAKHIRAYGFS